jgi:ankyrin repeat protein
MSMVVFLSITIKSNPNTSAATRHHATASPKPAQNLITGKTDISQEERKKISEDLHDAAERGEMQELTRLLSTDKGLACINERDDCGRTSSVDCAIIGQKLECFKLLLEKGADVNATDDYGRTPLFYAASS